MYPRIFITDNYFISSYSLCIAAAIILAVLVAYGECKRYGLPVLLFPAAAFWSIFGGIIGAKVFDVVCYNWNNFLDIPLVVLTSPSGWMYYGAEIGGSVGLVVYLLLHHVEFLRPVDIGGTVLLLAHALGRLGCFLAGCCYGIPTNSWMGITFPKGPCPVHPTQLYESIPLAIGFVVLWIFRKRFVIPGTIYASYLIFYNVLRFMVEFYREDAYHFGILHFSPSQYIAVVLFSFGVVLLTYLVKHKKTA
ncbi:MAG: prolipoprotein diacylglyceryl transferase [Ignavibacteriae bacterium]|nr:MAG: prolipoprotein diacylglyceryl transferase [Ignavibacteriota bacterium]